MKKLLMIATVLMLALLPTGALLAQAGDAPQVNCADLAQEDCDLLVRSREVMEGLTSGTSHFTFDADLQNMPLLPDDLGTVGYSQETRFAIEPDALAQIAAASEMGADELAALTQDAQAYTDFIMELVRGTDIEQTISLNLSDEFANYVSEQIDFDLPPDLSIQYVLVDGILYVQMTKLAKLVPELGFLNGWVGFDLTSIITMLSEDGTLPLPEDAESFQAGLVVPGIAMTGMGVLEEDQKSAMFDEHTQITRLRDSEIDGVPVAIYASEFDLVGLLSDPDVQKWLIDLFGEELMATLGITKENPGAMPTLLAIAGPTLFNELEYSILQAIGAEDAYLYRNEVDFFWDLARVATIVGAGSSDTPMLFAATSTNENSDLNNTVVEAPQGALVLPVNLILQLLGGMRQ